MKLTHKGAARLGRHESRGFPVSDFEFKPEDFDGCFQNGKGHVVLTIEEAKEIIGTYIGTNCEIVKQHGIPELKIKNPNWLIHLLERIEQAETCDG